MKTKTKAGAPKPLGASPREQQQGFKFGAPPMPDAKALRAKLTDMAKKMEKDPRKRKAFIQQGMVAIEHMEAKAKVRKQFSDLVDEVAPILKKHGVKAFHLVANLDVDAKSKALGLHGWAASQKVGGNPLELIGMLTQSIQQLTTNTLGTSRF